MIKQKWFWWGILGLVLIIPVSQYLSTRLLFVLLLASFFVEKNRFRVSLLGGSWDLFSYLLVLLFGLLYTNDTGMGWRVMETNFSLLAMSFMFFKNSLATKKELHSVLLAFIAGVLLACLVCIFYSIWLYSSNHNFSFFFHENFTAIIGFQPTYLAYYIGFSLTVLLYFLYYEKLYIPVYVYGIVLIFLFAMLMLTGGMTGYVSMLFVFSFFMLKFLFEEERSFVKKMTFCISVLFLMAMLVISHFNFNAASIPAEGFYWERLSLWKSAIDANPDFLFGVGTGDYKEVLNEYYLTHHLSQFARGNINTHNQFLHTNFSNGLIGLVALLILIGRPLYLSVKYQNVLGILVFFSFIIYGMTEVFLGRYQGVVFFALLHQLFIHFYYSRQSSFSLKEI
jgi:O-antigen ligase